MPTITALPTPPSRDDPTNFRTRADAFLSALPTFASETNAVATDINSKSADVTTKHATVVSTYTSAMTNGLASAASNAATATSQAAAAAASASAAEAAWTAALAANPDLNPVIRMNPSVISADTTIPSGYNAYSAGPIEIAESTTVTVQDDGRWSIL